MTTTAVQLCYSHCQECCNTGVQNVSIRAYLSPTLTSWLVCVFEGPGSGQVIKMISAQHCVVTENIHTPPPTEGHGDSKGSGGVKEANFRRGTGYIKSFSLQRV